MRFLLFPSRLSLRCSPLDSCSDHLCISGEGPGEKLGCRRASSAPSWSSRIPIRPIKLDRMLGQEGRGLNLSRLDSLGRTWTHFVSRRLTWFYLASLGFTCLHLVSLGLPLSHLVSLQLVSIGSTWLQLVLLELIWSPVDSFGLTWTRVVSLGLT